MDRFRTPQQQEKTLKVLAYGPTKSGKSHFIHTATQVGPVLWQDTEHGSDYYDPGEHHGFQVAYDNSPEITLQAIMQANSMVKENGTALRPIVAIDSFSSVWYAQQEVAERLGGSFRAWAPAKKPLKAIYQAIMLSRCHVIFTARAKDEYEVSKGGEPTFVGIKPDIERGLPYAADIVLEFGMKDVGNNKFREPEHFFARVMGSRSPRLPQGSIIRDPKFADLLDAMQPGEVPEIVRDGVDEQVLATISDKAQLQAYVEGRTGWNWEEARKLLYERFGTFAVNDVPKYIEHLEGFYEAAISRKEEDSTSS